MNLRKHNPDTLSAPREVIEVEVERLGVQPSRIEVIQTRAVSVLKPIMLGGLVDLCDILSMPALAPIFLPLGMVVGYIFARWLDAPPTWRVIIAALVGVYWVVPFTSPIPVAAATAAFVYIFKPDVMRRDPILDR
ncbi:hypothetical protein Poly30_42070 [Planctomycetes bacterium Poly30]|uniref:Uncharacterized protein n=1 Tax=Saltatorellus ferox TaxID=2528018 RepID=A0A518EX30_9BACT|nr:hypothetical protein Poly30_42070 [Planctomycetes bacterium Poly30]